ncbi:MULTISPECIES: host specificity factor TipJ family phage tail protein [unclassified Rhizobium]|uniref:host specificity factor TipJ family phage tail protein n=1 Tax=unclassified Rhizobium TaxID=2613769 RepID=UPI001621D776|nr:MULTISPECIES: host specificity factor TipJ family phage tail protein [unclassified Rhizobium]MBB3297908.1 sulfur carrier protein ThiS [Rhizobium sp. BK112]MBB4177597.1 sulfur carrier protein ThiS [Rhizobium sp. BK109]
MQLVSAPAPVEIFAPGEGVDVYLRRSPLRQHREHIRVPACLSVAEILDFCEVEPSRLYITINGHSINQANWPRVRVKAGASVAIVKVPGKGMLKSILGAIVSIAAAIFAPYLLGVLAPALVGTAAGAAVTGLIGAGLTVVGSLVINALFPVAKPKQQAADNTKTLYSIGGAQNENLQYGAVPEIFGVHRISPPKAAGDYTEIVGDDQYLRQLFCVGYGPVDISDLKIAETPISKFEEATYEIITNHLTQSPTLYTKPVYEESVSVLLDSASGWIQRTTADNVDEISVDVSFPNGVYRYKKKNGERVHYGVNIEVHYAVADSGAWVAMGTISVVAASAQAVRRSLSVAVPRGQYDVRLWKSSADYSGDDTVSETAYWTAVRGRRNEPVISFSKPLTLIALRIKATNELNGTVNQLNCIVSPRIRSWNGISWASNQVTRNPADHFRQVLQGNANARPVADASIDLQSIEDWHAYCEAQGFTFDLVAADQVSVYDRLTQIAAAGRASVSFRDGKWGVVWDVAGSDIVQHFTPRNSSGFSSTRAYADLPHGFRVNFINRDNNYLNDERVVYDDGYTAANATKFEGLDFPGVTDTKLIWRHGRYHIAQLRLQRETYTLTTDFEHLVCTRGDRVRVNHDVVLWGLGAARVKTVSAGGVTLDDTFSMESGKAYSMRFRLADGTSLVRTVAGVDGEFTAFTFSDTGALPSVGDLVQFGENGMESVVLRVKSIAPQADLSAKLELVDDAPAILTADTGTIPPFQTGTPALVDYRSYAPTALSSVESIWTTAPPTSALMLSWVAPEIGKVTEYIVQYAVKGTTNWSNAITVGAPQVELRALDPGAYSIRIRAIFANGQLSGWLNETVAAAIFATAPADVTGFAIAVTGDLATLTWDAISADTGISHYEIRYSPVPSALITWQSASILRSQAAGSQAQVAPLRGTYLIKAVSYSGLQSANPAVIVSTIDGLTSFNAVEAAQEVAPFVGTKDGTYYNGVALILDVGSDVFDLNDFFEVDDFFLPEDKFLPSGYYYFVDTVDLGDIYTSRISAEIDAHGESFSDDFFALTDAFDPEDFFGDVGSSWNVSLEISVTDDDPGGTPVWSDWATLVTGDVSARGFRFRALLESSQNDVSPVVDGLTVTIDMPDRVIAGNDLVIGTGGVAIAFNPAFKHLQGVSIAAQGLATGDYYEITSKNETGFTIIFKNAAGAAISRTLDYVAKGYGTLQ